MNFKRTLVALLLVSNALIAAPFDAPRYQGYVTDPSGVLSQAQKKTLNQYSKALEAQTGAQVATAIIPEIGESWTIEGYANQLFERWGIGQKGKDNGLLFVIDIKEKKIRIEVGYGLEGIIPDGKAGMIMDTHIIPHFKEGALQKGIVSGHIALLSVIAKAYNTPLSQGTPTHARPQQVQAPSTASTVFFLVIIGLVILGMVKSPTFRSIMIGFLIASMFSRGRGGGMGHFGGSSGFGGFGGGMSGGGGASRGW